MHSLLPTRFVRRSMVTFAGMLILILTGATLTSAQGLIQPDGRINQIAHFGGDALYCVDANNNPTHQYSDFGEGGFRLLDIKGQELWFVPAADVAVAVEQAKATGQSVLVAEGRGTYGPVALYAYTTGDGDDSFTFTGYDEYGKPNWLAFKFCNPVGPGPDAPDEEELCTLISYYLNLQFDVNKMSRKAIKPVEGDAPVTLVETQIPCDTCPPLPLFNKLAKLASDRQAAPVRQVPVYEYCLEDLPEPGVIVF